MRCWSRWIAIMCVCVWLDEGCGGSSRPRHLSIRISLHVLQAVCNKHALMTQLANAMSASRVCVSGSTPPSCSCETPHLAGIAQRQSVYNIVGRTLRLAQVRKTDGYRLISGRSQDRNLLPALRSARPQQSASLAGLQESATLS